MFAIGLAGPFLASDSKRPPEGRIGRHMVDDKDIRMIDPVFERPFQPVRLSARNRTGMLRVKQD